MEDKTHERYKWIKRQVEQDAEYLYLMARLREHEPAFQRALNALSPEDRESILEHLGICGELSDRMMEICCFMP